MQPAQKQRLIGAAVLVALAVIFVPMFIEPPAPEGSRQPVSTDMPDAPERQFETRVIPLTPPADPAPGFKPTEPPASLPALPSVQDGERLPTVEPTITKPAEVDTGMGTPPAAAPAAVAAPQPQPQPQPVAPAPAAAAPVTAPAPTPPVAPAAPVAGSGFVVNLGAYGNTTAAKALEQRLRAGGVKVYSESIQLNGQPALRLRAGPFAQRAEAEAARVLAERVESGLRGTVAALGAAPAAEAPATAVAGQGAGWAVQLGAFAERKDADALRQRVIGAGYPALVQPVPVDGGKTLFRVRAGPEPQRARAERMRDDLRARLGVEGMLVTHP